MTLFWIGASLALMTIGFAWLLRRQNRLHRSLEETELRLASRLLGMRRRIGALEAALRDLEFDGRRARGEIRFDPAMAVAEVLAVHPRVREVLAVFGVVGSGFRTTGTIGDWERLSLAEACSRAGVDPAEVLDGLRSFAADPTAPIESSVPFRATPQPWPPRPSRN